jgi:hypothetical protein
MVLSGSLSHDSQSNVFRGFSDNILVALWLAFAYVWVCGILSWIAWWFIAVRIWVRQHFPSEELESPAWKRRMTITFSALLLLIVLSALLMAAAGLHPPRLARVLPCAVRMSNVLERNVSLINIEKIARTFKMSLEAFSRSVSDLRIELAPEAAKPAG